MSESKNNNLDKQYENIVKNQENNTSNEAEDLGSIAIL